MTSQFPISKSPLLAAGSGVALALVLLALRFPGSFLPLTIATCILFSAIFAHVLCSYENLNLLREQTARQELVFVNFGLKLDETGGISVWAANLGSSSFLVCDVEVRAQEQSATRRFPVRAVIPAGQLESEIPFDDRIFHTLRSDTFVHLDISLRCRGLADGSHQTHRKGFTIERGSHRQLEEGFTGLWGVACPKCGRFDFMGMKTDGLLNLDAAWQRQSKLEHDLEATCPRHESPLLESRSTQQFVGIS